MPATLTLPAQGRETQVLIAGGMCSLAGEALLQNWGRRRLLLVTDGGAINRASMALGLSLKAAGYAVSTLILPLGSAARSTHQLIRLTERLDTLGFAKQGGVLALGGGAVQDMAALACGLYLGGIPLCQMPTTPVSALGSAVFAPAGLAQKSGMDSISVGFPPELVLIDTDMLAHLPEPLEWGGAGELLRLCALMGDEALDELMAWGQNVPWDTALPRLLTAKAALAADKRRPLDWGWPLTRPLAAAIKGAWPREISAAVAAMLMTRLTQREGLTQRGTLERLKEAAARLGIPTATPPIGTLNRLLQKDPLGLLGGQDAPYLQKIGQFGLAPVTLEQLKGAATWTV